MHEEKEEEERRKKKKRKKKKKERRTKLKFSPSVFSTMRRIDGTLGAIFYIKIAKSFDL